MLEAKIYKDNQEPPKNSIWHKVSDAGQDLGYYKNVNNKWNKIDINEDVGDSEDSLVDFNNIITGFYLGSLELDSSYTWEIYTPKINIDQYVQNIGNGIYLTNFNNLYNLKGSNEEIIFTTNIDNCVFVADWIRSQSAPITSWYLIPKQKDQQYSFKFNGNLPAIILKWDNK